MRILFLTPHPTEGPSSRYRVEQYIPYLENRGIKCCVRPFISSACYKVLYKKRFYFKKGAYFLIGTLKRIFDLIIAIRSDIIFIHLEAYPFGPPVFEWILAVFKKKIIYDLDDAIYTRKTGFPNIFLKYLKWPSKAKRIIRMAKYVVTCNEYLADYASKFNKNVAVIHTVVDTDRFMPKDKPGNSELIIGWIGSHSTAIYLEELNNVFYELSKRYKFTLKIIGAGRNRIESPNINVTNLEWFLKDEVEQLQSFDIGVYPLPKDDWVLGKTGFKTIQYMSIGVPAVVSDIGANKIIIQDGVNGFLAQTQDEWVQKLANLIEDSALRKRVGLAARQTIEEKYSFKLTAPRILKIIQKVYNENNKGKF